jgi:hypothetical protein
MGNIMVIIAREPGAMQRLKSLSIRCLSCKCKATISCPVLLCGSLFRDRPARKMLAP